MLLMIIQKFFQLLSILSVTDSYKLILLDDYDFLTKNRVVTNLKPFNLANDKL